MSNEINEGKDELGHKIGEEWDSVVESESDRLENMEDIVKENIDNRDHFKPVNWLIRIKESFNRLLDNLTSMQQYAITGGAVAAIVIGLTLGWFISPSKEGSQGNAVIFKVAASNAQEVDLAGDFSAYKPINMKDENGDGVWKVRVPLKEGKYEYYYLIDGKKVAKNYPLADEVVRDWKNRKNGIRFIGEENKNKQDDSTNHGKSA